MNYTFPSDVSYEIDINNMTEDPILKIEHEASLPNLLNQVKDMLLYLERDIDSAEYQVLYKRIELLKDACVIIG